MSRTRLSLILSVLLLGAAAVPATAQDAGPPSFFVTSVGLGDGANLGGLEGADAHCTSLAAAAGLEGTNWKAYLSTQGDGAVNARDRIGDGPWYNVKGVLIATSVDELHDMEAVNINNDTAIDEKGEVLPSAPMSEVMARNGLGGGGPGGAGGPPGGGAPGGAPPAGAPPGGAPPAGGPPGGGADAAGGPPAGFQIDPNAQMSYEHDILTGTQADGTAFAADAGDKTCANWTSNSEGTAMLGHHDRSSMQGGTSPWNSSHDSGGCSQPALVQTGGAGRLYCFLAD